MREGKGSEPQRRNNRKIWYE